MGFSRKVSFVVFVLQKAICSLRTAGGAVAGPGLGWLGPGAAVAPDRAQGSGSARGFGPPNGDTPALAFYLLRRVWETEQGPSSQTPSGKGPHDVDVLRWIFEEAHCDQMGRAVSQGPVRSTWAQGGRVGVVSPASPAGAHARGHGGQRLAPSHRSAGEPWRRAPGRGAGHSSAAVAVAGALHAHGHHSSSPPSFTNNLTGDDSLLSASRRAGPARGPSSKYLS